MSVHTINRLLRVVAALLVTSLASALPAGAAPLSSRHSAHRHRHHPATRRHTSARIPQQNGGDRDSDNNGGRSDGDGEV